MSSLQKNKRNHGVPLNFKAYAICNRGKKLFAFLKKSGDQVSVYA